MKCVCVMKKKKFTSGAYGSCSQAAAKSRSAHRMGNKNTTMSFFTLQIRKEETNKSVMGILRYVHIICAINF